MIIILYDIIYWELRVNDGYQCEKTDYDCKDSIRECFFAEQNFKAENPTPESSEDELSENNEKPIELGFDIFKIHQIDMCQIFWNEF